MSNVITFPKKPLVSADGRPVSSSEGEAATARPSAEEAIKMSKDGRATLLQSLDKNRQISLQAIQKVTEKFIESVSETRPGKAVGSDEDLEATLHTFMEGVATNLTALNALVGYALHDLSINTDNLQKVTVIAEMNQFRISTLSQYLAEQKVITAEGYGEVAKRVMKDYREEQQKMVEEAQAEQESE